MWRFVAGVDWGVLTNGNGPVNILGKHDQWRPAWPPSPVARQGKPQQAYV